MSSIDELIAKLCPNGVRFYKLIDVCDDIIVPMRDRPKDLTGSIPWCRIEDKEGQYFNRSLSGLGVTKETIKKMNLKVFPTGTVICSCSASIGAYAINTQPLITNQTFIGLVCGEKLFNKYLLYYMETQTAYLLSQASTGTIPYISRKKFEQMFVPVPPIEIQREIVRILDNFTELTMELTTELIAELSARQKQYEYYLKLLLQGTDECEKVLLGDVATIKAGTKPRAIYDEEKQYEYINAGTTNSGYVNEYNCEGDTITTPSRGQGGIGYVGFQKERFWLGPLCYRIQSKDIGKVANKFLYYYLVCNKNLLLQYKKEGGTPAVNASDLVRIELSIPSIETQRKVIETLDRFDMLYNDLKAGIPAEISSRLKQYEYYRDKLLCLKEK